MKQRPAGKPKWNGPRLAGFPLALALTLLALLPAAAAVDVPRWQPHDFAFKADVKARNPFLVAFSAEVKGPGGKSFTVPGFFDGDGTWKVRVSPTIEGPWSLVTKSDLGELDGRTAAFTGRKNASPNAHGVLRVDQSHPHHFIFEDGTRFFLQGYEYDWLWALDMDKPGVPTVEKSLDLIARQGYAYCKHFGDFWRATDYWTLDPSDNLVSTGWCLANPGREHVVFQNKAQPFTLEIAGAAAPLQVEWSNPHTGQRTAAGSLNNGTASLTPPVDWANAPLVMHVRDR